jgi:hypothetical protein
MRNPQALNERMYSGKAKPAPAPKVIWRTEDTKSVEVVNGGETLIYCYKKIGKIWNLINIINNDGR